MDPGCDKVFWDDPWLKILIRQSLQEDIGAGDLTTSVAVDPQLQVTGYFTAREAGVLAGLPILALLYAELSCGIDIQPLCDDGDRIASGKVFARITGPAAAILTGERTALNFLQNSCGIASLTRRYVDAVSGTDCSILDTRKTLPGYRNLAKYAVRCGGGENHRMGLYDRILLKDNHWAARDASLHDLVARGRDRYPGTMIEIEVDSLAQLAEVLPLAVEWVLLDNFTPAQVLAAVAMRDAIQPDAASPRLEASGNLNIDTVRSYAETGVDAVSIGRLTHSVPALDLGLDFIYDKEGSE